MKQSLVGRRSATHYPALYSVRLKMLVACVLALALSACGFKLRGDSQLPNSLNQISLYSASPHSPMMRALEKRFSSTQITVLTESPKTVPTQEGSASIYLLPDNLDRRLLSLFPTGQVAEYELIYSVRYHLQFANQEAKLIEFDVTREYQDDPDAALAKSRELELVLTEMRAQAADQIIRELARYQLESGS